MRNILGFFHILICLFVLHGCSRCTKNSDHLGAEQKEINLNLSEINNVKKTISAPKKDANLDLIYKISNQGDQIFRAALGVVDNNKQQAPWSAFGKLMRASQQARDGRLNTKVLFNCDQYTFTQKTETPLVFLFYEHCRKNESPTEIGNWTFTSDSSADVEFVTANLSEVLGLRASLFASKNRCQVKWNPQKLITHLSCPGWEQDLGQKHLRWTEFVYHKDSITLLSLKGQILQDLIPIRKIDLRIPMEGAISIIETELQAPPQPPKPVFKPRAESVGSDVKQYKSENSPPNSETLSDPDMLQPMQPQIMQPPVAPQAEPEYIQTDSSSDQYKVPQMDGQIDGQPVEQQSVPPSGAPAGR